MVSSGFLDTVPEDHSIGDERRELKREVLAMADDRAEKTEARKFAEKLTHILKIRGMSQSELARRTGLTQTFISQLASGKREPYLYITYRLVRVLSVSCDYLANDSIPLEDWESESGKLSREERILLTMTRAMGFERCLRYLEEGSRREGKGS